MGKLIQTLFNFEGPRQCLETKARPEEGRGRMSERGGTERTGSRRYWKELSKSGNKGRTPE